jgi:hypothetical protein
MVLIFSASAWLRSASFLASEATTFSTWSLLGVHLRLDERDLADALGGHAGFDVGLFLLLLDDGLLLGDDDGALALHLDGGVGDFDFLFHLGERHGALAADAGLLALLDGLLFEALLFLAHGELALLHGAVHVLGAEADGFLGFEALGFDFEAAGLDDLGGLGLFVGAHLGDGAGLLRGVLFVAALLLALGDVGVGVFLFDLHLRALGEFVGEDFFALGDLGDFLDALGVEDVVGIVLLEGRLLEVVDGDVLEEEAVEVLADGVLDLVAELGALGEELVELHLFAGGFEGLGEFRFEELAELVDVGDALGREHLGDLAHAVGVASTRM